MKSRCSSYRDHRQPPRRRSSPGGLGAVGTDVCARATAGGSYTPPPPEKPGTATRGRVGRPQLIPREHLAPPTAQSSRSRATGDSGGLSRSRTPRLRWRSGTRTAVFFFVSAPDESVLMVPIDINPAGIDRPQLVNGTGHRTSLGRHRADAGLAQPGQREGEEAGVQKAIGVGAKTPPPKPPAGPSERSLIAPRSSAAARTHVRRTCVRGDTRGSRRSTHCQTTKTSASAPARAAAASEWASNGAASALSREDGSRSQQLAVTRDPVSRACDSMRTWQPMRSARAHTILVRDGSASSSGEPASPSGPQGRRAKKK